MGWYVILQSRHEMTIDDGLGSHSSSIRMYIFAIASEITLTYPSTTYVGQVMAQELGREPDLDYATRMGELAMTFNSVGE